MSKIIHLFVSVVYKFRNQISNGFVKVRKEQHANGKKNKKNEKTKNKKKQRKRKKKKK